MPYGEGCPPKEIRATRQLFTMVRMIAELECVGGSWSIENPGPSYLWRTNETQQLIATPMKSVVSFHQGACIMCGRPDGDPARLIRGRAKTHTF